MLIGVIAPTDEGSSLLTNLYKNVVEHDINEYVAKLPAYRFTPPVYPPPVVTPLPPGTPPGLKTHPPVMRQNPPPFRFEFQVVSAAGSADVHYTQVKNFQEMGVNLIIGGF